MKNKLLYIFVLISFCAYSQSGSNSRHYISTLSKSVAVSKVSPRYMQSSIGQSSISGTQSLDNYVLRQGVIQPFDLSYLISNNSISNLGVVLFPNPAVDKVYFKIEKPFDEEVFLSIYNALGNLVYTKTSNNLASEVINIKDLTAGNYFLSISVNNQVQLIQFLKSK